jgi:hypothetical protein
VFVEKFVGRRVARLPPWKKILPHAHVAESDGDLEASVPTFSKLACGGIVRRLALGFAVAVAATVTVTASRV